ncbi:TVP38/TMEM64 family protein [Microvirgula aerodenitrificans]|uniref:TVP38/TMEM64 family protein n=1 Tax=Microvirgula aerodenitrificans TaxID=57480 RepID=UPI001B80D292|nr:TVP38/TMEM64 family protein [Microvirgula aerodenitrificans]
MALYAMVFVLATLAFLPASPLTAIAGYLYGPLWGTLLISPVGVLSAVLAFGIGRRAARPRVQRRLAHHPRLAAADRAVERGGFRVVFLLRLASIVPFAPLSYVLGASKMPARDFSLASWLGLLPGTFLYAYLGSLASDVTDILSAQAASGDGVRMLTWLGMGAVALVIVVLARSARAVVI